MEKFHLQNHLTMFCKKRQRWALAAVVGGQIRRWNGKRATLEKAWKRGAYPRQLHAMLAAVFPMALFTEYIFHSAQ